MNKTQTAPRSAADLITHTPQGLYCPAGDFHIDPLRPVPRALITHAHADHARAGHGAVLATAETLDIMRLRLGDNFCAAQQALAYGEALDLGGVEVSLHPAGHVLGSAQARLCRRGYRLVISGDYKRAFDPTCAPFELMRCDAFVTEATFGLPVFRHPPAEQEIGRLLASQKLFPERAHLVGAYSLGKAQRVIALLRRAGYARPIYLHGAMERVTAYYASRSKTMAADIGECALVAVRDRATLAGEIVICPPSALADAWAQKFPDPVAAFASGWMRVRARARQRGVELPLTISDHADWDELCATMLETGAQEIWVTHGESEALAHFARTRGLAAQSLHLMGYGEEESEPPIAESGGAAGSAGA
jgi:putative mRNA 3-end processing factor